MIYSDLQLEQVDDDEYDDELVLIGIEVDEDAGTIPTSKFDQSVHFPQPRTTLTGGCKYVVLMPDSGLPGLYSDSRLEVHHAPDEIAKCLLNSNQLSPVIFARDGDMNLREMVFDQLGLTDKGINPDDNGKHPEYRRQLREIAGLDTEDVQEEIVETRADELVAEYKYSELQSKAKDLGIEDARQSKDDLAEYIAENEE